MIQINKLINEVLQNLINLRGVPFKKSIEIVSFFLGCLYAENKSKLTQTNIKSSRYHLALTKNLCIDKLPSLKPALQKHILETLADKFVELSCAFQYFFERLK